MVFLARDSARPDDPNLAGPETPFQNKCVLPDDAAITTSPAGVVDTGWNGIRHTWLQNWCRWDASCADSAKQGENN
jgi:hypothetical protein